MGLAGSSGSTGLRPAAVAPPKTGMTVHAPAPLCGSDTASQHQTTEGRIHGRSIRTRKKQEAGEHREYSKQEPLFCVCVFFFLSFLLLRQRCGLKYR